MITKYVMFKRKYSFSIIYFLFVALAACNNDGEIGDSEVSSNETEIVCIFGQDQTCNNSAEISSIHGICQADGTCKCIEGWEKDLMTGKCK